MLLLGSTYGGEGGKAPGQPCVNSLECEKPTNGLAACGAALPTDTTRVCIQEIRGKLGDPCQFTGQQLDVGPCTFQVVPSLPAGWVYTARYLDDGVVCQKDAQTGSNTCNAFVGIGNTCGGYGYAAVCVPPSGLATIPPICVGSAYCTDTNVCAARRPAGSDCQIDPECARDTCDPSTGRCT